jgi:hypothetical protein
VSQNKDQPWREPWSGEERRHRRPDQELASLRRLTAAIAVAAASLNAVLFFQTGIEQLGPGDFQNAVVSALEGIFPGAGPQPAASPTPLPSGTGVVTTGGS